jgi:hypothetical protein
LRAFYNFQGLDVAGGEVHLLDLETYEAPFMFSAWVVRRRSG